MKSISPTLKAALATGNRCYLLKIVGNDGNDYGFTNHDKILEVDGVVYNPTPGLKHLSTYYTNSSEVSSTKFDMAYVDVVDEELVRSGVFDGAYYEIYRVAWDNLAAGKYVHDKGNLAAVKWTEHKMTHETHGFERNLAQSVGSIESPTCRHVFGDQFNETDKAGACTLNTASYTFNATVTSIINQRISFRINTTGQPSADFNDGKLTWTSGNNNGIPSPIKKHTVSGTETIELALPTLRPIQIGDTCNLVVGCDKTFERCRDRFTNTIHFGGEPYMNPGATRR